jgi:hypothetical protein
MKASLYAFESDLPLVRSSKTIIAIVVSNATRKMMACPALPAGLYSRLRPPAATRLAESGVLARRDDPSLEKESPGLRPFGP